MGYAYCATKERAPRTVMRSGYSECYNPYQNGRYPPAPGQEWDVDWGFPDPDKEPEMSPSMPFLTMPKHLKGWVGGEKGFDPLGVTDALPVYWVREAELKHGRVCMLATLGWITTDLGVRFPGDMYQVERSGPNCGTGKISQYYNTQADWASSCSSPVCSSGPQQGGW